MARELHPFKQAPETPPKPPVISGYTYWSAHREDYAILGNVGYYKSGDYVSATISLRITFYDGDEAQCTIDLPANEVPKGLAFLKSTARGSHWETLDTIEQDYLELVELAREWFRDRFSHELP